jgi:hypothetical protein
VRLEKNLLFFHFYQHHVAWVGSVLNWNDLELAAFAQCLSPIHFKTNEEVSVEELSHFIIAEGAIEIHAIVQDVSNKNSHLRSERIPLQKECWRHARFKIEIVPKKQIIF